ncbi:MAG: DNA polymerase IV [Pikeienuella sp.]
MPSLCRDCFTWVDAPPGLPGGPGRCPRCASPRLVSHPELRHLTVAHIDADAFYASVEKRERPELVDRPLIVGGGRRGVVTTCCYIARIAGVRSAMPMFKALALCPDATVVRPRMALYAEVSRGIRAAMAQLTPLVEPLSLDEAFLDLSGTERLLGHPPAESLARLTAQIERDLGIDVSVGLSVNKFLAKTASDLDKPRGFAAIGAGEAAGFLAPRPVRSLWGVGAALAERLERGGFHVIGDLAAAGEARLAALYGAQGLRLAGLARGEDARAVCPDRPVKSISSETTFETDLDAEAALEGHLWRLAVKVSDRAKAQSLAGGTVTLKVKTACFKSMTRQTTLPRPTVYAGEIYAESRALLSGVLQAAPFRLIGVGLSALCAADAAETGPELFEDTGPARRKAELVTDTIRERFGTDTIFRGRALR